MGSAWCYEYREAALLEHESEDTDVYVLRKKRMVSVSPLSLDLTSRVDFAELDRLMNIIKHKGLTHTKFFPHDVSVLGV